MLVAVEIGVATLGGAVGILALSFFQPRWLIAALERAFPGIVFTVPTDQPLVALTFDDGPDPAVTPRVLRVLRREQVRATWFITGSAATKYPGLVRAILDDGHEVANHMWDRTPAWTLPRHEVAASVRATAGVAASDELRTTVRPASGWIRPSAAAWARSNGYRIVLGSVYTNDPLKPPASYIAWAIPRMSSRGDVVVLHVGAGRERTVEALPGIIARLRAKGLEPVRLTDLGGLAGTAPPTQRDDYLPTQNELNTRSSTSSTSIDPTSSSRE